MKIAIVGGGPAGLRAAEVASGRLRSVTLFDAMPSVGRKFLVAGRGGLNLTHGEPLSVFAEKYAGTLQPDDVWSSLLDEFPPSALRAWAEGLGIDTFEQRTGRVYPEGMKAAPLLRRWVARLRGYGVEFRMKHKLTGLSPDAETGGIELEFRAGDVLLTEQFDAVVLAMGGGSWPQTGSDSAWTSALAENKILVQPLRSANCGWETDWPPEFLAQNEGAPLKNIQVRASGSWVAGELLVTRYGLEGGTIYQLGPELHRMQEPVITIDLKPTFSREELAGRLSSMPETLFAEAVQKWKLGSAAAGLLKTANPSGNWTNPESLADASKGVVVHLTGPRPLAEAISTAGGVCWSGLDGNLMIKKLPGVFVAGEMLDWEAPTGGYLMQGAFVTGTRTGKSARQWASNTR